jgi:hypothetical protein
MKGSEMGLVAAVDGERSGVKLPDLWEQNQELWQRLVPRSTQQQYQWIVVTGPTFDSARAVFKPYIGFEIQ